MITYSLNNTPTLPHVIGSSDEFRLHWRKEELDAIDVLFLDGFAEITKSVLQLTALKFQCV